MDLINKRKGNNKGLIIKTWERCTSLDITRRRRNQHVAKLKSNSWPRRSNSPENQDSAVHGGFDHDHKLPQLPPPPTLTQGKGCFSVYVGSQKQRFVLKTDCLNNPLFINLLEEAELEYGFNNDGPLELPCEVDYFLNVLVEMDCDDIRLCSCTFGRSYHLLIPPKLTSLSRIKQLRLLLCSN